MIRHSNQLALTAAALMTMGGFGAGCTHEKTPATTPERATKAPLATPVQTEEDAVPQFIASEPSVEISDDALADAVRVRLIDDDTDAASSLAVKAEDGVVTLAGTVDSLYAERRAVEIARRIRGTTSVVEEIAVEPPQRTDDQILKDVRLALSTEPALENYQLPVRVANGVVTMTGIVPSWAEKDIANEVVERVRGVSALVDEVVIVPKKARLDADIQRDVSRVLQIDVLVDDGMINVQVDRGRVELTGTVGSAAERQRAVEDSHVAGATSVDASGLSIEWWARDRFRRSLPAIYANDGEIEHAVRDAFLFDPRLKDYEPSVDVDDGTVTIKGVVGNLDAKRAAASDARNTVGVLWVVNDLTVNPPETVADEILKDRIRRALDMDPVLRDRESIAIAANGGVVTLAGQLKDHSAKARAGDDAARQRGVIEVRNEITVETRQLSDTELRNAIEDDLIWNPFVVAANVLVGVNDGQVTLRGMVADWHAYREAAEVASRAGAKEVVNELRVHNGQGAANEVAHRELP